ncbi:MAG: rod shape-determining protein MreD [Alphaproteobacteria bacterium]|nr:rod shape-determining protein MreD [Alphaproteobacteria bacterium]
MRNKGITRNFLIANNFMARFKWYFIRNLPKIVLIALLVFSYCPVYISGFSVMRPQLELIGIYFWTLHRPDRFGVLFAFSLGILADLFCSTPFGVNVIVYTLFYIALNSKNNLLINQSFYADWGIFTLMLFPFMIVKWLIISIYYARFVVFKTTFGSIVLCALIFPFVVYVSSKIASYMAEKEEEAKI